MKRFLTTALERQRGAVLVHVAIAMVGLLGFSSLVIDYGVFWMSRRQAQNSADAGALAGAIALSYDDPTDFTDSGAAKQSAHAAVLANKVFGESPDNNVTTDVTILYDDGPNGECPDGSDDTCVKVDVYRTVARGNPLPAFFARLMGITTQDVSATATAKVLHGNATECMRPFAILDRWDEWNEASPGTEYQSRTPIGSLDPDWNWLTSTFDKYARNPADPIEPDLYVPPAICDPPSPTCDPGTGFRPFDLNGNPLDYGREIQIHTGAQDQTSAGFFQPIRLKVGDNGASDYCANIKECSGVSNLVGQTVDTENGNMVGPTDACLFTDDDSLYSKDPTARWEPDYFGAGKGAVVSDVYGVNASPRIVPMPVVDPDEYFATDPNGRSTITIRNILGFFVERQDTVGPGAGHTVTVGRLINVPGQYVGGGTVDTSSNFITQIILIR
jgi:Flp pilus assembly protein TadG